MRMLDADALLPRVWKRRWVHDRHAVPAVYVLHHGQQPRDERASVRVLLERDYRLRATLHPRRARCQPFPSARPGQPADVAEQHGRSHDWHQLASPVRGTAADSCFVNSEHAALHPSVVTWTCNIPRLSRSLKENFGGLSSYPSAGRRQPFCVRCTRRARARHRVDEHSCERTLYRRPFPNF